MDGVYVYDDLAALTSGPCRGPEPYIDIFPNTGAVTDVGCILYYQNSNIELYQGHC